MRRGLLLIKNKIKNSNKNYPVEEKQDRTGQAWQSRTGQDRARQDRAGQGRAHRMTNWHRTANTKEIIKGANEEGNEERRVGQINQ